MAKDMPGCAWRQVLERRRPFQRSGDKKLPRLHQRADDRGPAVPPNWMLEERALFGEVEGHAGRSLTGAAGLFQEGQGEVVDAVLPVPSEVGLDPGIAVDEAVLLVGAVDDPHAVDEEVGQVEGASLLEAAVVLLGIFELVVGGAADDGGADRGDRGRAEDAARGAGGDDVRRLGENREIAPWHDADLEVQIRAAPGHGGAGG